MSDNPNDVADEIFASDRDRGDDSVSPSEDRQPEQVAQPEPQGEEQPEQEASESSEQPREQDTGRFVPVGELTSERKKRQEAERLHQEAMANAERYQQQVDLLMKQAAQPVQQQPQQPQTVELPDPYEDPEGYTRAVVDQQVSTVQQQMHDRFINAEHARAVKTYGADAVQQAIEAAGQAGMLDNFEYRANAPFDDMIAWHKRVQVLQTVGDDPAAYRENLEKEIREKVLAELKSGGPVIEHQTNGNGQQQQPQRFPGSLVDATSQGTQGRQMSQQALADDIFASDRNRAV